VRRACAAGEKLADEVRDCATGGIGSAVRGRPVPRGVSPCGVSPGLVEAECFV
jgi:hypothetical protein